MAVWLAGDRTAGETTEDERKRRKVEEEEEEQARAPTEEATVGEEDRVGEDDGGKERRAKGSRGASGEAFFFGPWSSHRVITRDEGAYMSNLYSARSSVSKFEST